MFATGISFRKADDPLLGQALSMIRPGITAPTRHELSTKLLDQVYTTSSARRKSACSEKRCTLTTDAWTNVNGNSVINYIGIVRGKPFVLESVETGGEVHTIEFLTSDIQRVITAHNYLKLTGVVTALRERRNQLFLSHQHLRLLAALPRALEPQLRRPTRTAATPPMLTPPAQSPVEAERPLPRPRTRKRPAHPAPAAQQPTQQPRRLRRHPDRTKLPPDIRNFFNPI
ncbi:TPA: hypothetical protein N0F65_000188 [Lagenidium giganteum]|uniref:DUF659 domain-containing protein n=1 Tax=Lagenidium giganteum TaxID=4803 RepID=A0AAV2YNM3_9STRA|nr:TPA: hypothetical protein N0F65_000188 [Lagenidium giganteum]